MKKKNITIVAALAVILMFTVFAVGCDMFGTVNAVVKGVPVNFRFRNAAAPATLGSRSAAPTARAAMGGTTTDTASFSAINSYYSGLGALQPTAFTPTRFEALSPVINADVDNERYALVDTWCLEQRIDLEKAENSVIFYAFLVFIVH